MTSAPFISVIIPTYNRREKLLALLELLGAQTYSPPEFEVIVVDDGSTDGTAPAVMEAARRSRVRIACLHQARGGPSAARNAGAAAARGTVLAFTEDDVTPEAEWLERGARYFLDSTTAALEGLTRSTHSENLRSFESPGTRGFLPCNLFVRRETFLNVGGFDPAYCDLSLGLYFREDADFGFRLLGHGDAVLFGPDVVVAHPEQFGAPRDILRHVRRYLFDPLLYRNHPALFRKFIEVKRLGPIVIRRPFHYLCWFYLAGFIVILAEIFTGRSAALLPLLIAMLALHAGIRFRYERRKVPALWNVRNTLAFAVLPFTYLGWFIRGCVRFRSWGALF
jgi:glycosyltransferase involved in cell wall biosynthesis